MSAQDSQPFHWRYNELDDSNFQIRGRTLFFVVVLFSVVLLVTLFVLYARWVCRFHDLPSPSTSHATHAPPPRPQGLDPATIDGLPIILHLSSSATNGAMEESECCICLGEFEDGDKVKVLPQCQHCYHCDCVDRWLSSQSSCPLCRISIRVDPALPIIVTE